MNYADKVLSIRYRYCDTPIRNMGIEQSKAKQILLRHIKSKEYAYEYINECIVCGNGIFETVSQRDRHGIRVNIVICNNCGLLLQNPRLTKQSEEIFIPLYIVNFICLTPRIWIPFLKSRPARVLKYMN